MTIQEIKAISISGFLSSKGYEPVNKKGYKWWYLSPLHTEQTASFKVDLNKNVWYDFGLGKGGNIIDLAMELYHTQNVSEVMRIMNHSVIIHIQQPMEIRPEEKASFERIVVKELEHTALLSYLSSRGINSAIAKSQCVEIHYKNGVKHYFAIGFKNDAGGYELRNPYFEGFMDYLSYLILHGECDAVVLNSIVNLPNTLSILNEYSQICCHLDNDIVGKMATRQIMEALGAKCADASNEYGAYKDLNEYLMSRSMAFRQKGRNKS